MSAESLQLQATALLSDIDQLAYSQSDARFRATAMPVRLRIAEISQLLSGLSDGTSTDEPMDFSVLNAVSVIREKLELIQALLGDRQTQRHRHSIAKAGQAIAETASELVRALHDQTAH